MSKEKYMNKMNCFIAGMLMIAAGQAFAADSAAAAAPQGAPAVTGKKVLVVYYSRTGNTKKVAEDLATALGADIEQLIDKKDRSGAGGYLKAGRDASKNSLTEIGPVKTDASRYDLVVIGTPVWAWNMTPAVRTYITANKALLKKIAVFTTAGGTKPEKIVAKIEELAGQKAMAFAGFFAGEINGKDRSKYNEKLNAFVVGLK